MNRKCVVAFLSVAAAVASGCGREVISVGTGEELVSAIGPNRIIELRKGTYDLSSVTQRKMEFVRWSKVHDGYELIVRNVSGLKLIGVKKAPRLLAKPRYANVLNFEGCKDIALENLVLGHTPEGFCTGGVVTMTKCNDVAIDKCDLFGCGIFGLELHDVNGMRFSNSIIRDCTYGIMIVKTSSDIVFSDSSFVRNREFSGFSFSDSRNIRLERCALESNRLTSYEAILFKAKSCSDIVVSGCTITGNMYKNIMAPAGSVKITGTQIEDNTTPPDDDR